MDYELTEYREEMGEIRLQDGFIRELQGKSIPEQLHCYGWSKLKKLTEIPYTELEEYIKADHDEDYVSPLQNDRLIVKDGLVVGVVIGYDVPGFTHAEYILPYGGYIYDSSSDNNGAGYKERDWWKHLVCLPYSHTLWK